MTLQSIWTAKFTVSEFLKRLIGAYWRKSFEMILQFIRYFLLITFIAVVIATLSECQPFTHYWQVIPDPGPKCRQGYAQLITMGTCDVITDLLLVAFPIPIVFVSAMPTKRKVSLILLFALSLALVGITCYRVPSVINRRGAQQFRSLLASLEILAAAAVSNALIIGSFIRDRGVKKQKYKFGSSSGSTLDRTPTHRATVTQHHWGSDADLVGDLGMSLNPELQSRNSSVPRPAPVALPNSSNETAQIVPMNQNWQFPRHSRVPKEKDDSVSTTSTDHKTPDPELSKADADTATKINGYESSNTDTEATLITPRKKSFFDVGGLLESNSPPASSRHSTTSPATSTLAQGFATQAPAQGSSQTSRRGSRAFLQDFGGMLSAHQEEGTSTPPRPGSQQRPLVRNFSRGGAGGYHLNGAAARRGNAADRSPSPAAAATPPYRPEPDVIGPVTGGSGSLMELQDAGGLLTMSGGRGVAR